MKNIQFKSYRWLLVVVSIILVLFVGSQLLKTDEQKFYDKRENIEFVDSSVLLRTKEICLSVLEKNIKDMYIYVNYIDGSYICQLHTLTSKDGEYLIYDIVSDNYKLELPFFLYKGKPSAMSIYSSEYKALDDDLYTASASIEGQTITIIF